MRCPFCQHDNDRVLDTRASEDSFSVRRRRCCNNCRRRFTTYERVEEIGIRVIKKDLVREPLNREKIRGGIETACWKRPPSRERIDSVVEGIVAEIHGQFEDEVSSRQVGEIVMRHLAPLDEVAFVRFASVYQEFDNMNDFVKVLAMGQQNANPAADSHS